MHRKLRRRDFLKTASTSVAGVAMLAVVGCSGSPTATPASTASGKTTVTLWYWNGSIDDKILAQVDQQFPTVHLVPDKIGGDFKSKLLTTMAGRADVPDITGINSDISTYFPDAAQFVNLYDYGAKAVEQDYLDWKWKQGVTPGGKMIGFPMDSGPTALYYRFDMFQQAGLPTDPPQVAATFPTWEDYFQAGAAIRKALPRTFLLDNITNVFTQVMAQSPTQYMDPQGNFIGDQPHVKRAWDLAVKAYQMGLSANAADYTADWDAAVDNGTVATFVGAVWMKNGLEQGAVNTAGKWRVAAAPGGPGNNGGSFLAITTYSQRPQTAFDVIKWVETPQHQLLAYQDVHLFPSTPSIYGSPQARRPESFFGGQTTFDVFSASAEGVKPISFGPAYDLINPIYGQQLTDVATQGKDPQAGWNDALQQIRRELSHEGYTVP